MREDLIASAVDFLQDPKVAASPLEKRVAFLQSKNLTKEEVDAALLRAGGAPSTAMVPVAPYPTGAAVAPVPGNMYGGGYFAGQQRYAPFPHEMQRRDRDWRDWFIMATVTTAASYGLYHLARRYVTPLISPPTPPQLETDKAHIDAEFAKAFSMLDTLSTDTALLKTAEEERKTRVDAALQEVESVIQSLKDAGKRREDESKRVGDEVRGLRDLIPKALEGQKESQKKALEDLQTELKSLKQLVMNRTGAGRPSFLPNGGVGTPPLDPGAANGNNAGSSTPGGNGAQILGVGGNTLGGLGGKGGNNSLPFGGLGSRPTIPAWQMAAANKSAQTPSPAPNGESAEGSS